jgi:hypothetical protein
MASEVGIADVDEVLAGLEYPLSREEAAEALDGVTVHHEDEATDLGELVSMVGRAEFEDGEELREEIHSYVPPDEA